MGGSGSPHSGSSVPKSLKLIVRPEAEDDILDIALWYESREGGLGVEVTAEIRAATQRALENPLAYLIKRNHPQVRRVLVRRFPYRLFYIVRPDTIVVFAVLHAARHERYWQSRL